MERRSFLLGGVAAAGAALAVDRGERLLAPAPPAPRSARPHGGHAGLLQTRVVWHADPSATRVALTFDDGPSERWTPRVLDLLARHDVCATFFVVGSRAADHPDLLARTVAAGHELGNHTWTHADLCRVSPAAVREELERTHALLDRRGVTARLVRPPWGHVDAVGLLAAAELDATVVLWSELVRADAAQADLAATLRDVRPGSVVLAHDGGPTPRDVELAALDGLLTRLRERGYGFATVSDLLRPEPPAPAVAQVVLPQQRGS